MTRAYNCAKNTALLLLGKPCEYIFPQQVFDVSRVLGSPPQPHHHPRSHL